MIKHSTMLLPNNVRLVLSEDKSKNQTYAEISVLYGGMTEKYKYQEKRKNNSRVSSSNGTLFS